MAKSADILISTNILSEKTRLMTLLQNIYQVISGLLVYQIRMNT